jgi:serine/threonine protein kinase
MASMETATPSASHQLPALEVLEGVGITIQGWMMKKGGTMGWSDRWFELHGNILKVKKTPEDREMRSEFTITDRTTVADLDSAPCGLQVIFDGNKALKLRAASEPDSAAWKQAIQAVIKFERESRKITVSGFVFDIPAFYEMSRLLGKGAYGCVVAAVDTRNGANIAIKKVGEAFADKEDAKRILREIRLMRSLRHHPNVLRITDLLKPPSLDTFDDVYIVTEQMTTDLQRLLQAKKVVLTEDQQQWIMYQILCGLKYLHTASVLHRDLKPANVLVNTEDCSVKICDFGLSRVGDAKEEMTDYVVTRWYRAPEVLMNNKHYGDPIDMWAVGCIFAEIIGRRVLLPGKDFVDQLRLIVKLIGSPESGELEAFVTDREALKFMRKLPPSRGRDLVDLFPDASAVCLALLRSMLTIDPAKRISDDDAIAHPYLRDVRVPKDHEFVAGGVVEMEDIEGLELSKVNLQRMIFQEIIHFHADLEADSAADKAAAAMGGLRTADGSE